MNRDSLATVLIGVGLSYAALCRPASWILAAMLPENVIRRHLRAIRLILCWAVPLLVFAIVARLDWAAGRAVTHEIGIVSIDDELYVARLRSVHHAGGACVDSNVMIERQWAVGTAGNPYPMPHGLPWMLAEVDAPYQARFRRISGTLTDSLRVDWRPPNAVHRAVLRWSDDGESVEFAPGLRSDHRSLGLRLNVGLALVALLRVLFFTASIAVVAVALICWVTGDRHWVSMRVEECPECGYDLRGSEEPGCPECGWERRDENATA